MKQYFRFGSYFWLALGVVALNASAWAQDTTAPAAPAAPATGGAPTATPARPAVPAADRWESAMARFEAADKVTPPPVDGVVFIGSSTIAVWRTLAKDLPEFPAIPRGFGGSQMADSARYADRIVTPYRPRMVVVYAGGNDFAGRKTVEQVFADFQAFAAKVHAVLPATKVISVSLNPTTARAKDDEKVRAFNRMVEEFTRGKANFGFIDSYSKLVGEDGKAQPELLRPDGIHLSAEGYKRFTAILKPQLEEWYRQTPPVPPAPTTPAQAPA